MPPARFGPLPACRPGATPTSRPRPGRWTTLGTPTRLRLPPGQTGPASASPSGCAEGQLDPTWAPAEAAALLWELTSFRVWDNLVNDAHIAPDGYVEIITATARSTLGAPITPPASPKTPSAPHGSTKADSPTTR